MEKARVFISVPMRNRTDENIEKSIEKIKKISYDLISDQYESVEFVDNFVKPTTEDDILNYSVYCLGEAIKKMSKCNVVVTLEGPYSYDYKGMWIEKMVAENYDMRIITLDTRDICPDVVKDGRNEDL